MTTSGDEVAFTLRSRSLARWVELSLDGAETIFDDNYFDLPAGREVCRDLPASAGLDGRANTKQPADQVIVG